MASLWRGKFAPLTAIVFVVAVVSASFAFSSFTYHNVTDSMPRGWYWPTYRSEAKVGDLVLACMPLEGVAYAHVHHIDVPPGRCPGQVAPVLKHVIATSPSRYAVTAAGIVVDGAVIPNSRPIERASDGAALPRPHATQLRGSDVVLWSPSMRSYDSRYWGVTQPFATAKLLVGE